MNSLAQRWGLLTVAMVLAGCTAFTEPAEDPVMIKLEEIDRRLQAVERVVQNQSLVKLSQQVTALERRVDQV